MIDADKQKFAFAITALMELFGQEATKPRLHAYWLGLQALTIEQLNAAVQVAMARCKRLPLPYELMEFVGVVVDDDARANLAWGDVLRAVPLGCYKHVDFEDKIINAVVRNLGGWVTFLERFCDAESEKWARLEFIRCYKSFARSGVNGEAIKPLAGLSQAEVVNGLLTEPIPRKVACDASRAECPYITGFTANAPRIERQPRELANRIQ